jgi:hypothetical protein
MSPRERTFIASPTIAGGASIIASPFQFYTTGEDRLLIIAAASVPNVAIKIQARLLDPDGTIRVAVWTHTPTSDRAVSVESFALNTGAVMNVVMFASGDAVQDGQVYAQLFIRRGDGPGGTIVGQLLGGYFTRNQPIGWPGSPIRSSVEGQGAIVTTFGQAPAPGAQYVQPVPSGARWELQRFAAGFIASPAVPQRILRIQFLDNVDLTGLLYWPLAVQANETWFLTAAPNADFTSSVANASQQMSLPTPTILRAGQTWRTSVLNMAAGDQWTNPNFVVREWIEVL